VVRVKAARKIEILTTIRRGETWAGTVRGKRIEMWLDQCGTVQIWREQRGRYASYSADTVTQALEAA